MTFRSKLRTAAMVAVTLILSAACADDSPLALDPMSPQMAQAGDCEVTENENTQNYKTWDAECTTEGAASAFAKDMEGKGGGDVWCGPPHQEEEGSTLWAVHCSMSVYSGMTVAPLAKRPLVMAQADASHCRYWKREESGFIEGRFIDYWTCTGEDIARQEWQVLLADPDYDGAYYTCNNPAPIACILQAWFDTE